MENPRAHGKIVQLVRDRLERLPELRQGSIHVEERQGIITLSGRVTSYRVFYAAQEAAAGAHGVRHVINELDVSEARHCDE